MKDKLNISEWEIFCTRTWGVWKDRCNLIHKQGNTASNNSPSCHWSDNFLQAFRLAADTNKNQAEGQAKRYSPRHQERHDSYFSIHTDATFNLQTNRYAYGFILKEAGLRKKAEGGSNLGPPGSVMNAEIVIPALLI